MTASRRNVGVTRGGQHRDLQRVHARFPCQACPEPLPGYSLVDLGVSYPVGAFPVGAFKFNLNVNNVLDERFFPDACCVDRGTPGEPRNWQLGVSTSF